MFKIAKHIYANNRNVIGENCVKNDKGDLAVTNHENLLAWQEHYERLLNEEFDWNEESLASNDPTIEPRPKIEVDTVRRVLGRMKCGKAAGSSGVVAEMLQASGEVGISRMTDLFNGILDEYKIPEDWNTSVTLNCFKNKGEVTDRGNYRGLKLLEHLIKVFEKVIEEEIRRQVSIYSMQFGFVPGRGTIDAISIARQLQERYLGNKKKLYFAFFDPEKVFDRVPREVVRGFLRKLAVMEWLVRTVMAMYTGSKSRVRINNVLGNKFSVKAGVHQGSVPSPLLFIVFLEALSCECRNRSMWEFCMLMT